MKKILKFSVLLLAAVLVLGFAGCGDGSGGGDDDFPNGFWDNEPSGTLTVLNNTSKDMLLFQGQTPSVTRMLGGVRANTNKTFDISDDVDDFEIGGYIILRGMSLAEYEANKSNLNNAKVEYSAMATYGQGKKFRTEINPAYSGDYYYKVTNGGRIGMELRKDSPDGEKIGYLPALATNQAFYFSSPSNMTIFPVYVYYNRTKQEVTTLRSTSFAESFSIGPRPVTDSSVPTARFPTSEIAWETIAGSITYPVAFITITNSAAQSGQFSSSSTIIFAQNGYDSVNSGETLTFEIKASDVGLPMGLNIKYLGGTLDVSILQDGKTPTIKNGYDYTVTFSFNGGEIDDASSYTATITEGTKRDVTEEIISL